MINTIVNLNQNNIPQLKRCAISTLALAEITLLVISLLSLSHVAHITSQAGAISMLTIGGSILVIDILKSIYDYRKISIENTQNQAKADHLIFLKEAEAYLVKKGYKIISDNNAYYLEGAIPNRKLRIYTQQEEENLQLKESLFSASECTHFYFTFKDAKAQIGSIILNYNSIDPQNDLILTYDYNDFFAQLFRTDVNAKSVQKTIEAITNNTWKEVVPYKPTP